MLEEREEPRKPGKPVSRGTAAEVSSSGQQSGQHKKFPCAPLLCFPTVDPEIRIVRNVLWKAREAVPALLMCCVSSMAAGSTPFLCRRRYKSLSVIV